MLICESCGRDNPVGARFCNACGAALATAAAPREVRKTVTVLFCDVTGSTALGESTDPEALRALLARYFERMKAIVESHGGTVEKFIGDAVMAVFGIPAAHEDDALRACRAAVEMRDALAGARHSRPDRREHRRGGDRNGGAAGDRGRGERGGAVRAGGGAGRGADRRGDACARARRGGRRAGGAAESEGKSEPVPAYRLVSVLDAPERSHASQFVGRDRELAQIVEAWERAEAQSRCEL